MSADRVTHFFENCLFYSSFEGFDFVGIFVLNECKEQETATLVAEITEYIKKIQ